MRKKISVKNISGLLIVLLIIMLFLRGCMQKSNLVAQKGNCNLEILSAEPASPAVLQAGEKVYVKFRYNMGEYDAVQIWVRPRYNGAICTGYTAHMSAVYNRYDGVGDEITGWFSFDEPALVDEIIIRMKDNQSDEYVCVAKKDASFEWKGDINITASLRAEGWDDKLQALADKTKDELINDKKYENEGALIYRVHSDDGKLSFADTQFHYGTCRGSSCCGGGGGYRPGSAAAEQAEVMFERDGRMGELRVKSPGYHEFRRSVTFEKAKVTVWDDIVLEHVTPETECTIKGTVYLEDNADAGGITVTCNGISTAADANGNFTLSGLGSGHKNIAASKSGYWGMFKEVETQTGQTADCELNGYRKRKAKVRWVYQPGSSKNFTDANTVTGTAALEDNVLDRVSFASGFVQVNGKSDCAVYQKEDKLVLINTDARGDGNIGPGILQTSLRFEDLKEAPEFGRSPQWSYNLQKGDVYVIRCYDGEHYAKMEVLEIIGDSADCPKPF